MWLVRVQRIVLWGVIYNFFWRVSMWGDPHSRGACNDQLSQKGFKWIVSSLTMSLHHMLCSAWAWKWRTQRVACAVILRHSVWDRSFILWKISCVSCCYAWRECTVPWAAQEAGFDAFPQNACTAKARMHKKTSARKTGMQRDILPFSRLCRPLILSPACCVWQMCCIQARVHEISSANKAGMQVAILPFKIGMMAALTGGLCSIPLCFHLETVMWFNDNFGEDDIAQDCVRVTKLSDEMCFWACGQEYLNNRQRPESLMKDIKREAPFLDGVCWLGVMRWITKSNDEWQ